jgi:GT2 family glycosyltransferase
MTATVVIVSRNRKDELMNAVRSAVAQTIRPQVLVIDDGSGDGTAASVSREFPAVTLVRHDQSAGLVVRRNEGARAANGDVIFSIDDDAAFTSPRTVEQTLAEFDDPRIGAVAIPFIEPRKGPAVMQRAPGGGRWVTDCFIGTSHAIRRDVFLALGGYREQLVHQGEERDFCIRLLQAGYVVRLGSADPIHHYESPKRDFSRMDYYGRRNDVLFVWHYVPWAHLPVHLAGTVVNAARSAWEARRISRMAAGTVAGLTGGLMRPLDRQPVSRAVYRLHRRLKKAGPELLDAVMPELPAPGH